MLTNEFITEELKPFLEENSALTKFNEDVSHEEGDKNFKNTNELFPFKKIKINKKFWSDLGEKWFNINYKY